MVSLVIAGILFLGIDSMASGLQGEPLNSDNMEALIINPKWNDVPSAYYPTVSRALQELGIQYDIRDPDTITLETIRNYSFVFMPPLSSVRGDWSNFDVENFESILETYAIDAVSKKERVALVKSIVEGILLRDKSITVGKVSEFQSY